jgi:hypothetical protein
VAGLPDWSQPALLELHAFLLKAREAFPEAKLEMVKVGDTIVAGRDTMAGLIWVPADKVMASYNTFGEGNGTKNRNNR